MNKKEKTLILNALTYSKSPSYWGINNVKNYLRELQNEFKEVLITVKPEELRNRIFLWIEKCDPKLEKFFTYNKVIEYEKGKTCQLFEIPSSLVKEIDDVLKKQKELPYDAFSMGSWEQPKLVFSSKKGNTFEMWYAIKASKNATKAFDFDRLPENVKDELFATLQNIVHDNIELEKVSLGYNIFNRIINIIRFDPSNRKISITTDQPKLIDPDNIEKNIVRPEDMLIRTFDRILVSIGVSKTSAQSISEKKRVNTESVKKIRAIETKKLLLFPSRFDTINKAGDLTAENITKFTNLTTDNISPIVKDYYVKNNSFVGFFKAFPNLDAQNNSEFLKDIVNSKNTENEATGFILFIVINSIIHVATILCNITTGSLRIFLKEGEGSYEHINSELDRIFS